MELGLATLLTMAVILNIAAGDLPKSNAISYLGI
jgi:hypothetical protein